jgi:hypothetical protein
VCARSASGAAASQILSRQPSSKRKRPSHSLGPFSLRLGRELETNQGSHRGAQRRQAISRQTGFSQFGRRRRPEGVTSEARSPPSGSSSHPDHYCSARIQGLSLCLPEHHFPSHCSLSETFAARGIPGERPRKLRGGGNPRLSAVSDRMATIILRGASGEQISTRRTRRSVADRQPERRLGAE